MATDGGPAAPRSLGWWWRSCGARLLHRLCAGVALVPPPRRYSQAGTPSLTVTTAYDEAAQTFTIAATQKLGPSNGQPNKLPMLIPLKASARRRRPGG